MPAPAAAPRWPVDHTGDPAEIVGATEAARVIGHPRPERLPHGLLELADHIERNPDGSVKRRGWKRETLWHYARTAMVDHSTHLAGGRLALDRHGIAERLGIHLSRVDAAIAAAPANGFPAAVDGRWRYADDVETWYQAHQQDLRDKLTRIDYTGDPDDLLGKADAARVLGYGAVNHLDNSSVLRILEQLNNPEHNQLKPGGGTRLRWPRRIIWKAGEARTGRPGRPRGTTRTIDRSGDPTELVSATEAARVLGYRTVAGLPKPLLQQADQQKPRRWKRQTLWNWADDHTPS